MMRGQLNQHASHQQHHHHQQQVLLSGSILPNQSQMLMGISLQPQQQVSPHLQQQQQQQQQQMQQQQQIPTNNSQTISSKITEYLNDNNRLITQAYSAQCSENYENALENLEKLVGRMVNMMENADRNHKMRSVIYENREILSENQLKQYHELNQANLTKNIDQNYYLDYYLSSLPPKKQIEKKQGKKKVFWTEQEKAAFKDALLKYGKKDLKKISEYIGTKKPIQVRSHMQKHFKRLEKEGKQSTEIQPQISQQQQQQLQSSQKKQEKKGSSTPTPAQDESDNKFDDASQPSSSSRNDGGSKLKLAQKTVKSSR